jgi:prolyl-tRNA synthetase
MCGAYERVLTRLTGGSSGWAKARGAAGAMGGALSHEWHLLVDEGEDALGRCPVCGTLHNAELPPCCGASSAAAAAAGGTVAGCEVGHTFQLGHRYTPALWMGCYGLGVSRLLASLALLHPRWPDLLAPYAAVLVPAPRVGPNADETLAKAVAAVPLLPHQSLLLWDDGPRVSVAQRLERAALLRAPRVLLLRSDGSVADVTNEKN